MIRQVSFYLFYEFADALNTLHRLSDPTRREAHACGRHWLPKREGTHAVGRPSRRHVPHGVPRRKIGSRKGKAPTKWEGPPTAICLAVRPGGRLAPEKGRRPQSGKDLPWPSASQCVPAESLTCRKRLSPPRGTCSHTQCQAPDSSPRTTRSTH